MRSCPSCNAPAKPADKFCGQCGYPLEPDPGPSSQETEGGCGGRAANGHKRKILVIAVITIMILGIAAGAMIMKEQQTTRPVAVNQSAAIISYVIVEPEEPVTTVPTTLLVTLSTPQVTVTRAMTTPKAGVCPADRRLCDGNCTDSLTDRNNCGYCNTRCQQGQACVNGHCMLDCPAGKTACVEGCFDLKTDPDHCGICGNDCPGGLICSDGHCSPTPTFTIRAI